MIDNKEKIVLQMTIVRDVEQKANLKIFSRKYSGTQIMIVLVMPHEVNL